MSAIIPTLIGPINSGDSFMLVSIQNDQPFILNGAPLNNGTIYYWESNLDTITSSNKLGIFTANGTTDSLVITDKTNGGGLGFRQDGITLGNSFQPQSINIRQFKYSDWFPPDIFLSSVEYTIFNQSGATANILTNIPGTGGTGPTIPANNIIILPVMWYSNCTSSGSYSVINDPLLSIINWFCVSKPSIGTCSGGTFITSGWTNHSDCAIGNFYSYCPTEKTCGTDNCKGPCSAIYDDCNFSSNRYVCTFNPEKFLTETQWWLSPYFIGTVVGIFVIIIIIVIVIFVISRRGNKVNKYLPNNYQSYYISY